MTENFSLKALVGLLDVVSYSWARSTKWWQTDELTDYTTDQLTDCDRLTNWQAEPESWQTDRLRTDRLTVLFCYGYHDLPLNMTRNAQKAKIEELLNNKQTNNKSQINKRSSLKARALNLCTMYARCAFLMIQALCYISANTCNFPLL